MNYKIWLSAALMLGAGAAQAAGVGTTGASFLKVGVGARELALGSAASSLTEGAGAVNWNPARLAGLKRRDLSASYNMLFVDESQGFVGYAAPLGDDMGVFGAGVNYLTVSDIEKRTGDTDNPISKFSNNNTAVTLSYARPDVIPGLAVGGNLKYIQQKLDTQNDKALAIPGLVLLLQRQLDGGLHGAEPGRQDRSRQTAAHFQGRRVHRLLRQETDRGGRPGLAGQ